MKTKLKKYLKLIIASIISIIISLCIELIVFNFDLLNLDKTNQTIKEVTSYKETEKNNKKIIKIKANKSYINKLKIIYKTEEDVNINIKTIEKDYYNGTIKKEISDKFDDEINEEITVLRNYIDSIEIEYDNKYTIQIEKILIDNRIKINYFRILFIFSSIIMAYIISKYYRSNDIEKNLHKYFVYIGLIFGILLISVQPSATYYSWDDQIHFKNVYELIGGDFKWKIGEFSMIDGSPLGRESISSIEEQENQINYFNQDKISTYSSYGGRFITYNKLSYIPSALGFYLSRFLGCSFVTSFKIGKIMNLLTYLIVMGYAIKISKIGKKILTVIGLLPSSIFLACQYSYDPSVIAGITLFLVIIFNLLLDKNSKIDFKTALILISSILYACFIKAIYIPIILLTLFISNKKFKNKKQATLFKFGIIIICLLILYTFVFPAVSSSNVVGDLRGGATSVSGQLKLIFKYPIGFIKVLMKSMLEQSNEMLLGAGLIGNFAYLGKINNVSNFLLVILLIFVSITDNKDNKLPIINRIIILIILIGVCILVWLSMYLAFTPVGLNIINGVQPRYFLPLIFPILISLQPIKIKNELNNRIINTIIFCVLSLVYLISIYELVLTKFCF